MHGAVNDFTQTFAQQVGRQFWRISLHFAGMHLQKRQPGGVDKFLCAATRCMPLTQMQGGAVAHVKALAQVTQAQLHANHIGEDLAQYGLQLQAFELLAHFVELA